MASSVLGEACENREQNKGCDRRGVVLEGIILTSKDSEQLDTQV